MQRHAIIVAGGSGTRMGSSMPKQFLDLRGKPVIIHTLETFLKAYPDLDIILVFPEAFLEEGRAMVATFMPGVRFRVTTGGSTRFHSVQNGLRLVSEPSVIFVHDAVRCLVTADLIRTCHDEAVLKGSAIQ